jgi:hypothetical protein
MLSLNDARSSAGGQAVAISLNAAEREAGDHRPPSSPLSETEWVGVLF